MKKFRFYHQRIRHVYATRREFAILKIRKAYPGIGTATEVKLTEI